MVRFCEQLCFARYQWGSKLQLIKCDVFVFIFINFYILVLLTWCTILFKLNGTSFVGLIGESSGVLTINNSIVNTTINSSGDQTGAIVGSIEGISQNV